MIPKSFLRRLMQHKMAALGLSLLVILVVLAVAAPLLAPYDPAKLNLAGRLLPPSHAHWFGTDELGRDVLSRTLYGARVSLTVAVTVVTLSLFVGLILGAVAGFFGGIADTLINIYISNAFLSLPGILLAIAFVAFLGPSLINLIVALALASWVNYARLVRAQVISMKQREFVQAAQSLGASNMRLMVRHILPNIIQPLIVQAAVGMAAAVLSEATLSFLGLGIQPPTPTWGAMLNDARSHIFESPFLVFFPAAALALCVLAFNFLGDGLRDLLDPRTQTSTPENDMLIGVISDTHHLLRQEAVEALRGVDLILHAGDVGNIEILDVLRQIAPVTAIRGNIDTHGACAALPATEVVECERRLIYMLHSLDELDIHPHAAGMSVVISGHSHKPAISMRDEVMYLNPGSAGPRRFSLPVSLAYLRLEDEKIKAEIRYLLP